MVEAAGAAVVAAAAGGRWRLVAMLQGPLLPFRAPKSVIMTNGGSQGEGTSSRMPRTRRCLHVVCRKALPSPGPLSWSALSVSLVSMIGRRAALAGTEQRGGLQCARVRVLQLESGTHAAERFVCCRRSRSAEVRCRAKIAVRGLLAWIPWRARCGANRRATVQAAHAAITGHAEPLGCLLSEGGVCMTGIEVLQCAVNTLWCSRHPAARPW